MKASNFFFMLFFVCLVLLIASVMVGDAIGAGRKEGGIESLNHVVGALGFIALILAIAIRIWERREE